MRTIYCHATSMIVGTDADYGADISGIPGGGSSGNGAADGEANDGIPDVQGFAGQLGWPGATETFGSYILSDFTGPLMFTDPGAGWIMTVNDEVSGAGPFAVNPGDLVAFSVTVPPSGTTMSVDFMVGDSAFVLPMTGGDVTPDPFEVAAVPQAISASWVLSEAVRPSGFDLPLPISVTGSDALLYIDGSSFGVASGTLVPAQSQSGHTPVERWKVGCW